MKITIVSGFFLPTPTDLGGAAEKIWWRLARLYAKQGHDVTLISRRWKDWPNEEVIDGVRILRIRGANHRARLWKNLILDALWGCRVLSKLPAADILIANTIALPIFSPYLKPQSGKLIVCLGRYPKGQFRWYRRVVRIQVPTQAIADAVAAQAPALGKRIQIFHNSIDCAQFIPALKTNPTSSTLRIGFIGRIHPEKGIHTLVRAAALLSNIPSLPDWQLVLRGPVEVSHGGGGSDYVQYIQTLSPELWSSGKIVLAPPLYNEEELVSEYQSLSIFSYPTHAETGEAQPIAVFEAMACGLPCVTSDLAVFKECIQDNENGFMVAMGDAQKLADTFATLLSDNSLLQRLGHAARETALRYDCRTIATQHLADYEKLLTPSTV